MSAERIVLHREKPVALPVHRSANWAAALLVVVACVILFLVLFAEISVPPKTSTDSSIRVDFPARLPAYQTFTGSVHVPVGVDLTVSGAPLSLSPDGQVHWAKPEPGRYQVRFAGADDAVVWQVVVEAPPEKRPPKTVKVASIVKKPVPSPKPEPPQKAAEPPPPPKPAEVPAPKPPPEPVPELKKQPVPAPKPVTMPAAPSKVREQLRQQHIAEQRRRVAEKQRLAAQMEKERQAAYEAHIAAQSKQRQEEADRLKALNRDMQERQAELRAQEAQKRRELQARRAALQASMAAEKAQALAEAKRAEQERHELEAREKELRVAEQAKAREQFLKTQARAREARQEANRRRQAEREREAQLAKARALQQQQDTSSNARSVAPEQGKKIDFAGYNFVMRDANFADFANLCTRLDIAIYFVALRGRALDTKRSPYRVLRGADGRPSAVPIAFDELSASLDARYNSKFVRVADIPSAGNWAHYDRFLRDVLGVGEGYQMIAFFPHSFIRVLDQSARAHYAAEIPNGASFDEGAGEIVFTVDRDDRIQFLSIGRGG